MSDTLNVLIQTCPVCNGQGHVSMPPWIPGDVPTWSASGTETYDCRACGGTGLIRRDVPTAPGRAAVVEPPREGISDYSIVADAVEESLADFIRPDDVAEPAIYADAIERAAAEVTRLRSALSAAQRERDEARANADQWMEQYGALVALRAVSPSPEPE